LGDIAPLSADRRPWITNHLATSNPSGASSGCALHFDLRGGMSVEDKDEH